MKKKKINSLALNKKTISKFNSNIITGGQSGNRFSRRRKCLGQTDDCHRPTDGLCDSAGAGCVCSEDVCA